VPKNPCTAELSGGAKPEADLPEPSEHHLADHLQARARRSTKPASQADVPNRDSANTPQATSRNTPA